MSSLRNIPGQSELGESCLLSGRKEPLHPIVDLPEVDNEAAGGPRVRVE